MAKVSLCGTSTGAAKTGSSANPSYISHTHTMTAGVNRILVVGIAFSGAYNSAISTFSVASASFFGISMIKAGSTTTTEEYVGLTWQTTTEIWYVHEDSIGSTYANIPITGTISVAFNRNLEGDINVSTASASFTNVSSIRSPLYYDYSTYDDNAAHTLDLPLTYYDNGYMFDLFAVDQQCYIDKQYQTVISRKNSYATGPITNSYMSSIFSTMETLDEPRWGNYGSGEPDQAWSYYATYSGTASSPPPSFDPSYYLYWTRMARSAVMLWPNVADFYITGRVSFPSLNIGSTPNGNYTNLAQTVQLLSSVEDSSKALDITPLTILSTAGLQTPLLSYIPFGWWSKYYTFRKQITVVPQNEPIPAEHSVKFSFSKNAILSQNKTLEDFSDIVVVFQGNNQISPVPTNVTQDEENVHISFLPVEVIEESNSDYFVYYGNLKQESVFSRINFIEEQCPIVADYNSRFVSYLKPGEIWIDGASQQINSYFSITAPVSAVRVSMQKSPNAGVINVAIDNEDSVRYDLFEANSRTAEIFAVDNLLPSQQSDGSYDYYHRINISIYENKNPVSSGNTVSLKQIAYRLDFEVSLSSEEVYDYGWSVI